MKLEKLLANLTICEHTPQLDAEIKDICFDSRKCTPGSLFVAVDGNLSDGHKYIAKAVENGAVAVVYQNPDYDGKIEVPAVRVVDSRSALALMASTFYDNPSTKLTLVGVTGTNGKTTTATLLYELFTQLGYHCGLLSTIVNYIGRKQYPADHTTPDPLELNGLLAEMVDSGCQYCFMEVSSHSID